MHSDKSIHDPEPLYQLQQGIVQEGGFDHVLDVLASYDHPFILLGTAAQRWMGAPGILRNTCDILIRDTSLDNIDAALVSTGHWTIHDPHTDDDADHHLCPEYDADLVLLRHTVSSDDEFHLLCLWTESTYCINVDDCETVEVPDVYPWQSMLIESSWHPALHRDDGWWFGPFLHPDIHTVYPHLPQRAAAPGPFFPSLPRGRSARNTQKIFVPSLGPYLDALVYHKRWYQESKLGLVASSLVQIRNLTRYLYLELDGQKFALLMVMEEDEFMEKYLKGYKRKPFFVYGPRG